MICRPTADGLIAGAAIAAGGAGLAAPLGAKYCTAVTFASVATAPQSPSTQPSQ